MASIKKCGTAHGSGYRVRWYDPDGKPREARKPTRAEAKTFATTVDFSKSVGAYVAPASGRTTVGALGPAWLARQRTLMKPSGFASYDSAYRTHVLPKWGKTPIAAIRHSDVVAWVAELSGRRGAEVVRTAHSVFKRILDDAVLDRLVGTNPALGVKMPRRTPRPHIYLTASQLNRLADESGEHRSLVLLLGLCGLRWSEAVALRVADIDFLRKRIAVHVNAVTVRGRIEVGTPKTNRNRSVPLHTAVIEPLAATAVGKNRDDLLWPGPDGGYAKAQGTRGWFAGAVCRCMAADPTFPRITPHKLRHTCASLAAHSDVGVLTVSRMLGHANPAMTLNVYSDLYTTDLDVAIERVHTMWTADVAAHNRLHR